MEVVLINLRIVFLRKFSFLIVIVQEFIKELLETCFAHLALSIITYKVDI